MMHRKAVGQQGRHLVPVGGVGQHQMEKDDHWPVADVVVVDLAEVGGRLLRFGPGRSGRHGLTLGAPMHEVDYLQGHDSALSVDRHAHVAARAPAA